MGQRVVLAPVERVAALWEFPHAYACEPRRDCLWTAMLLSLVSGLLFGSVPVRQVLRTSPYEVVKAGAPARVGRRITGRDVLLAVQISLCAVLVTASLVAVRGLEHALHGNFGFEPQHAMLVGADLNTAGYTGDRVAPMQKRMLDALAAIPGVEFVGLTDALLLNDSIGSNIFPDGSTDLRPSNAVASAYVYHISPEYLHPEGTTLLSGRSFTWHDDKNSPRIAIVNREFARKIFGSVASAIGGYFKMPDGTRIQVVGVTENGKYNTLTEEPHAALFLPILQWPSNSAWLVVRSSRAPEQLGAAIRSTLNQLEAGLPVVIEMRLDEIGGVLFPYQMASVTLGVMGGMGAMLAVTLRPAS